MSIGLAAMMTVQPILATPVFADEEGEAPAPASVPATSVSEQPIIVVHENTSAEAATEPAEKAVNVADTVVDTALSEDSNVETAVALEPTQLENSEITDFTPGMDETKAAEINGLVDKVKDDAEALDTALDTEGKKAADAVDTVKADLSNDGDTKEAAKAVDERQEELTDIVEGNEDKGITGISNVVADFNTLNENTDKMLEDQLSAIKNATSIQQAIDENQKAVDLLGEAETSMKTLEGDYKAADEAYKAKLKELEDAQKALSDAVDKDDKALSDAEANLKICQDAADKYKADAEALKDKYTAAKDAMNKDATEAAKAVLAQMAELSKYEASDYKNPDNQKAYYENADKLFKYILQYYYLPMVYQDTEISVLDTVKTSHYDYAENRPAWAASSETFYNEDGTVKYAAGDFDSHQLAYWDVKIAGQDKPVRFGYEIDTRTNQIVIYQKDNAEYAYTDLINKLDVKDTTADRFVVREGGVDSIIIAPMTGEELVRQLNNGTVVKDGDNYYFAYNTVSSAGGAYNTTVADSTVDGVTTKVTYSNVKSEDAPVYSYDAVNNKIVKTTTGHFTKTTVVEGTSLTDDTVSIVSDGKKYTTEDAAKQAGKAALDAALSAKQEAANSDATEASGTVDIEGGTETTELTKTVALKDENPEIDVTAEYSADATVEYRTKFTTTINLNDTKVYYDGYRGLDTLWTQSAEKNDVRKAVIDAIKTTLGNKEAVGITENSNTISVKRSANWGGDNKFTLTGSITFTYYIEGKATGSGTSYTSMDDAKEKALTEAASKKITKANSISVDKDSLEKPTTINNKDGKACNATFDWNAIANTSKGELVDKNGNSILNSNAASHSNAIDKDKLKTAATFSNESTKYSYNSKSYDTTVTTAKKVTTDLNDVTLTKTDSYDAIQMIGEVQRKLNTNQAQYIKLDTGSEEYQAWLQNGRNYAELEKLEAAYNDAATKAGEAAIDLDKARKAVIAAKNRLAIVTAQQTANQTEINALKAKYEELVKAYNDANTKFNDLAERLAELEAAKDLRVARPTPSESEPDYTPFVEGPAPSVAIIGGDVVAPTAPMFTLPASTTTPTAGVAGARTRRTGNGVGNIEETAGEGVDAAGAIKEELPVVEKEDNLKITDDVINTIQDEQVPLAAFPENETAKMNWWWLLLIAVLGVTGEEMYRRNQKKKEEKAALSAEMNKKDK